MDHKLEDTWTSDALLRGDIAVVMQRVLTDPDYLSSRDHFHNTPLQTAIEFLQIGLVEVMLQQGADPNVEADDGSSCLMTAVEFDDPHSIPIVEKLIAGAADIHRTGINGWTPLHMASARGYVDKAKLLLEAGASVNQRTGMDGSATPLMEAAAMGHPEVVELLLEYGAEPRMRDSVHNFTPLELAQDAARDANPQLLEYLKSGDFRLDPDGFVADLDLSANQKARVKSDPMDLDIAEPYHESAEQRSHAGRHQEVIRILAPFELD